MNVSAYEVGINSPSRLTLNHRLTCAPVVEKFLLFPGFSPNYSFISARTTLDTFPWPQFTWIDFAVKLSSVNGPNFLSNESSGLQMARENGPTDVTVLPRHIVPFNLSISEYQKLIQQGLRRDDGQSLLIVYRAGRGIYYSEVDDPYFAAHNVFNLSENSVTYYLPDYESTALGCVSNTSSAFPYCRDRYFVRRGDIQDRVLANSLRFEILA